MDDITSRLAGSVGITDDIVVYGGTEQEHNENLHAFMKAARENGLVLNSKKSFVKQTSVKFFGMVFGRDGMRPDPAKVEDSRKIPSPTSQKQLQTFIGMIQYLSPIIKDLADRAAPLRDLLKESVPFQWDADHEHYFELPKSLISKDALLQYYDMY